MKNFILKGDICFSNDKNIINTAENSYAICVDSVCKGVFSDIPQEYCNLPVLDYTDKLIIPGLTDLHLHAPQFSFCGLSMDLELLEWLNKNTFIEESKYSDSGYARKAYSIFADALKNSATTRACIFATIHLEATKLLMDLMENTGLVTYIGKVNMDRNSPDILIESSAQKSASDTEKWLIDTVNKYQNTKPIITPRFIPSCSDELMECLGELAKSFNIPAQSHLSENKDEIEWVKELCPDCTSYGNAYEKFGLFGNNTKTVMAHCVHSSDNEIELMKKNGVFIAHCPKSNTNLSSGIAPIRKYLDNNMKLGLGSDVAGGETLSMFSSIAETIKVSKLYFRLIDSSAQPLTFENAFYLATKGGGEFFGKVGSFDKGYEFDAVVIDDSVLPHPQKLSVKERLERAIYQNADLMGLKAKFVRGQKTI
ncbi:MAG: amidohydrolase family protein [Eubacteriales bacterium]|nr:amidohydrolase family protein [Eubacteriales bacterium]